MDTYFKGSFQIEMLPEIFTCSFSYHLGDGGAKFSATDSSANPKLQLDYPKDGPTVKRYTASITASVEYIIGQ